MLASISFICGILIAAAVLAFTRRQAREAGGAPLKPTALGWCTLAFGLTAGLAFIVATRFSARPENSGLGPFLISITFAFAAVVTGIGSIKRQERHWPTWVGLVAGLVPAIFWILFAAGNIFLGEY